MTRFSLVPKMGRTSDDGVQSVTCLVDIAGEEWRQMICVPSWSEGVGGAYQRNLSEGQVEKIRAALEAGGEIDQELLVSCRGFEPEYDARARKFSLGGGWLIDGQHRTEAAQLLNGSRRVTCVVTFFLNVTEEQERFKFLIANSTGLRASASHLAEVRAGTSAETVAEAASNQLFDELAAEGGPLDGLVYDGKKRGGISRKHFAAATRSVLAKPRGAFKNLPFEKRARMVRSYLRAASLLLPARSDLGLPSVLGTVLEYLPAVAGRAGKYALSEDGLAREMGALSSFRAEELPRKTRAVVREALADLESGSALGEA